LRADDGDVAHVDDPLAVAAGALGEAGPAVKNG